MPSLPWQRQLAKTRQPYQPKLVVLPGTPCYGCDHPRSSHSVLVLHASCKADQCPCPSFDPQCGCSHTLIMHSWGTQPDYWSCCKCPCKHFGARMVLEPM
jgi:hypothetical protein